MKRVFIAINLPGEIKEELGNLEKEIADMFPEEAGRGPEGEPSAPYGVKLVKWVRKDNLHLTLLFIGAVRDEEIPRICEIVKGIAQTQKSFSLKFEKVCYGPTKKMPPRLIWVETERNLEMSKFAEELKAKMVQAGILRKAENRPFTGHITLGRIKVWQWKRLEPEERPEIEREIPLEFEVKSVEIMESVLKRTGAEYVTLESIKLL